METSTLMLLQTGIAESENFCCQEKDEEERVPSRLAERAVACWGAGGDLRPVRGGASASARP